MDTVHKDVNKPRGSENIPIDEKAEGESDEEVYSESEGLLPRRQGGMARKINKPKCKVQWNDKNGKKLEEILEYQPSEASDSDEEDTDACMCIVM